MTPRQIELVRDNFVHVLFAPNRAASLFYDRLFEIDPATRAMFTGDMEGQGRALISALATIVTGLARFDAMQPNLHALALRHLGYGVRDHHYDSVGIALFHMVSEIEGADVVPELEAAWREAYSRIATTMIEATRKAA